MKGLEKGFSVGLVLLWMVFFPLLFVVFPFGSSARSWIPALEVLLSGSVFALTADGPSVFGRTARAISVSAAHGDSAPRPPRFFFKKSRSPWRWKIWKGESGEESTAISVTPREAGSFWWGKSLQMSLFKKISVLLRCLKPWSLSLWCIGAFLKAKLIPTNLSGLCQMSERQLMQRHWRSVEIRLILVAFFHLKKNGPGSGRGYHHKGVGGGCFCFRASNFNWAFSFLCMMHCIYMVHVF